MAAEAYIYIILTGIILAQAGVIAWLLLRQARKARTKSPADHTSIFLSAVLDNAADGIVACDADGKLSLFNRAARNFHGVDSRPIPADGWASTFDLYDTDGVTLLDKENIPLFRAFNGEDVDGQEIVIAPRDGIKRRMICRGSPLFGMEGEKIGAVVIMQDVTNERLKEDRIRQQAMELQLIFDNVPVRIWYKDDQNKIIRLNKMAAESMGVTTASAEGANTYDLFPDMAAKYHQDDLDVINSGQPRIGIIEEYTPKAGSKGWVSTNKVPHIDKKTGARTIFVAATDITSLMRAKDQLRQSNHELEQFARVASHDLQEPLRKLLTFSEMLMEDLGEEIPEKAQQDIDAIVSSASRMHKLIKNILSLSRLGQGEVPKQTVHPQKVISESLATIMTFEAQAELDISWDELPDVIAEPVLLAQVYQNLISNALKFVPDGETPALSFTATREGGQVILGVRDNGIGMEEEVCPKIFGAFTRLHSRSKYEGTGIGLAICQKAVEQMGGKIWVESVPGEGSHFKFTLRAA